MATVCAPTIIVILAVVGIEMNLGVRGGCGDGMCSTKSRVGGQDLLVVVVGTHCAVAPGEQSGCIAGLLATFRPLLLLLLALLESIREGKPAVKGVRDWSALERAWKHQVVQVDTVMSRWSWLEIGGRYGRGQRPEGTAESQKIDALDGTAHWNVLEVSWTEKLLDLVAHLLGTDGIEDRLGKAENLVNGIGCRGELAALMSLSLCVPRMVSLDGSLMIGGPRGRRQASLRSWMEGSVAVPVRVVLVVGRW